MSQDTFARIMGLAAVVFLIYALVLGLEAVLGRELLPGPGVYEREVSANVPPEVSRDVERRADRGAADRRRERRGPPARTKWAGGTSAQESGTLDHVASASVEAVVADGGRSVERLLPSESGVPGVVVRLPEQPLAVLGE